jgi:cell division transport system permease protein
MHFLRFSVDQALQGLWRNRVMNVAATVTMVLMLVLLSTLVILVSGLDAGLSYVESKVEVRAELHDGLSEQTVEEFQQRLAVLPEVASVAFVSKEQAKDDFLAARAAQGQEDLSGVYGPDFNPFPAYFSIELADPRESRAVRALLDAEGGIVRNVLDQQAGIDRLVDLTSLLRYLGTIVLAFVGLTVLLIVINSIRMALMSRAQEIEIMRLVGASDRYVRWPFILEGVFIGLAGAIITLLLLLIASRPISDLASEIAGQVPLGFDSALTLQIVSIVTGAGLILGGAGAWISVRTYLRR